MNMFGQAKDLYKLQKKAKEIKAKLKNLHIEAESNGAVVTISAEQEVIDVKLPEGMSLPDLQTNLKEAFNKGIKKSQEVAANEMKELMGGLGMDLPNLEG